MEEEIRKKAIIRYLNGESPKAIYTGFKRSKKWFFKWLKRYQTGKADWYKEKSRAPLKRSHKINDKEKQLIVSIRMRLESGPFAQVGVSAIKWELTKLGLKFPSDSTINRILKREGLVKKNSLCTQRGRVPLLY
jgi:putative transposase